MIGRNDPPPLGPTHDSSFTFIVVGSVLVTNSESEFGGWVVYRYIEVDELAGVTMLDCFHALPAS